MSRHAFFFNLLVSTLVALGGCTASDQPLLVSQHAAEQSDDQAQSVILALGAGNRQALIDMGIPASQADAALATAPDLPDLPEISFVTDGRVGPRYFRQYAVTTAGTPPLIDVRVWLEQRGGVAVPSGLIVLPHVAREGDAALPSPES